MPETPDGVTCEVTADECKIKFRRVLALGLIVFLGFILFVWTLVAVWLFFDFFTGGEVELWGIAAFSVSWIILAVWFVLYAFGMKTVILRSESMHIEAGLWWFCFSETIPKDSIQLIEQIKDGGRPIDSFPTWGVRIKSRSIPHSLFQKLALINHFGNDNRKRTILLRHPYEHALLLATIVGKWTDISPVICDPPMRSD